MCYGHNILLTKYSRMIRCFYFSSGFRFWRIFSVLTFFLLNRVRYFFSALLVNNGPYAYMGVGWSPSKGDSGQGTKRQSGVQRKIPRWSGVKSREGGTYLCCPLFWKVFYHFYRVELKEFNNLVNNINNNNKEWIRNIKRQKKNDRVSVKTI